MKGHDVLPLLIVFYAVAIPAVLWALRLVWKTCERTPGHCPICGEPGPEEGHEECGADWSIK